jgi:aminodeoxyfutalosine deaminase
MNLHMQPAPMLRVLHAAGGFDGRRSQPDVALVLRGDTVVEYGAAVDLLPRHTGIKVERIEGVIAPGLVNAHTHLELSALAGKLPSGAGFVAWVDALMAARSELTEQATSAAIVAAIAQLVAGGTVALGEVSNTLAAAAALASAPLKTRLFHEYFGTDPLLATPQFVRMAKAAAALLLPEHVHYAQVPHALHTTSPHAVQVLLAQARAAGARLTIHLAEHPHERALLESGTGAMATWIEQRTGRAPAASVTCGMGPVARAAELGLLGADILLVHMADANERELAQVAESSAHVVLCPRSNAYLAGPRADVGALIRFGAAVALGTDSLASCASLSVAEEAAYGARNWPETSAEFWLAAATAGGAAALGLDALGEFAPGKRPGAAWVAGALGNHSAAEFFLHHASNVRRLAAQELAP